MRLRFSIIFAFSLLAVAAFGEQPARRLVPDWASRAVFYQIFPERFRNGDPSNDPTLGSLEYPEFVAKTWRISPWTGDWYARDDWEMASGDDFYQHGVFHRRYGGDLQGVLDKLDYLCDLGVNTLYFNPVFYARSLHKYDGNSFHHIDPYFGPDPEGDLRLIATETSDPATWKWTAADKLFLAMVKAAHRRELRIVIDGVFNHTGRDFFAFADLREKQEQSVYKDWYIVKRFDDPATPESEFAYQGWWDVETLPLFADNAGGTDLHPGPKQYVFDATRRWMDPDGDGDPTDGIDGWRLDVAGDVPIGFWSDWNTMVRKLNPDAYTVAELWGNAAETLVQGRFSATMNYYGFAFPVKAFLVDGKISAERFAHELSTRRSEYPAEMRPALQNLLDSHDTERIASMIVNRNREQEYRRGEKYDYDVGATASPRYFADYNVRKPDAGERRLQRMIALFQFTYVGAPMIYYGTEAGMWGADDPDDRKPMLWADLKYDDERASPNDKPLPHDEVEFDQGLFAYYRQLTKLRSDHASLRGDSFQVLHASESPSTLVFAREGEGETTLVVLNRAADPKRIAIDVETLTMKGLKPVLVSSGQSKDLSISLTPAAIQIQIQGLTGAILVGQK